MKGFIKYIISPIIIFLYAFTAFGQKVVHVEEQIGWEGLFHSKNILLSPIAGYWNDEQKLPYIVKTVPVPFSDVSIDNFQFESVPLSKSEIAELNKLSIPDEFKVAIRVSSSKDKHYAFIEVNGVRWDKSKGNYYKITSFQGDLSIKVKSAVQQKSFVANSAFASGDWYKIGLIKSGVYRVDFNYLNNIGALSGTVASNAINIYGNGTGVLDESNDALRYDDVVKNSIFMEDGGDGIFGDGDYFLFYGVGPHVWNFDGTDFVHTSHPYCDTSYYYIEINENSLSPKRISNATLTTAPVTHSVSTFIDRDFIEDDLFNLGKSGREWYGDIFDVQTVYNYSFNMPNIVASDSVKMAAKLVGKSSSIASVYTLSGGGKSQQVSVSSSGSGTYAPLGIKASGVLYFQSSGNTVNTSVSYDKNGYPSSKGWLDYIEVNVPRRLIMDGSQMYFNNAKAIGSGNIDEMVLQSNGLVKQVWEVTDPRNVKSVDYSAAGNAVTFRIAADSLREFVGMGSSGFLIPIYSKKVQRQDLHGLSSADMIIITLEEFLSSANNLADFHNANDGLTVHVVTAEQVYNEFSSGMCDVTAIKHFLKMFYDRAGGNQSLMPKYCLLFGDATYDVRNRMGHNTLFIPTYESKESLSVISTYATDDYFAILSDGESMLNSDIMDIAVGRLPIKSVEEARGVVNKIQRYASNDMQMIPSSGLGADEGVMRDWRNVVCLVSDDGDNNVYFWDTEEMEDSIVASNPNMNVVKVHSDAYVETTTPGGERNYGAEEAIKQRVERGALLVNYIGHGGETGWSHERILTVPTILGWTNLNRLPVFMTATCEFSRYDDHDRTSGGEFVVLNPDGGGIALFTTTRLVYNSSNKRLNKHFHSLFYDKVNGDPYRIGDVYLKTKEEFVLNGGGDINYRKFALLGDPAVKIALPQYNIVTDSLNGVEITGATDSLKALSTITINGHLEDVSGVLLNNFNGMVYPVVYDKKKDMETLANSSGSSVNPFQMWTNIVYKGKASVKNGKFEFSFVVPKDISFQYGNARISYYAQNAEIDAQGYSENAIIGGVNLNAQEDSEGPAIDLFMNDDRFVSGGITDENPDLYARIFDENGINMVGSGIGHNIEAVLDDNTSESVVLNDYYEADLDTYKSGEVRYPFSEIEEGPHTLSLKVWDVYNNSSKAEIEFVVAKSEDLALDHVLNYPNPFTTYTEFFFEHNQVADFLDVSIQIFTISGKLVKTISQRVYSEGFRSEGISWNGLDDYGDKLARGVYVYKLKVRNERGEHEEKIEKLVILK